MKTRRVMINRKEIPIVNHRISSSRSSIKQRRKGAAIIVVLALLMALLTLGFLFLTLSSQEMRNTEWWIDANKDKNVAFDPEPIFGDTLGQLFSGTDLQNKQSVLYGSYHTLLGGLYGSDLQMSTGEGINLIVGGSADQDYDGFADPGNAHLGTLNHSPSATGGVDRADVTLPDAFINFPQPDVPYTYGDHTSLFLSYDYVLPTGQRVIVPSYFRPQMMRGVGLNDPTQWHSDTATAAYSKRPHWAHTSLLQDGTPALDMGGTPILRFIRTQAEADSIAAAEGKLPGTYRPFPFPANEDANGNTILDPGEDTNGNGVLDRIAYGVWSGQGSIYQFDVDNDGDGVKEGVWLDLGHLVYTDPNGKKFIPMVSITIKELDSKFNVNVHGNYASVAPFRVNNDNTGAPVAQFGGANPIHRSNQGVRRSEINLQYALDAAVPLTGDPTLEQHRLYFDNIREPANTLELANLEWFWMLTGRPELELDIPTGTINVNSMIAGRWGEQGPLGNGNASAQDAWNPSIAAPYPAPGWTGRFDGSNLITADDNNDRFRGGRYNDASGTVFPVGINFPSWRQPLDLFGAGSYVVAGVPAQRRLFQVGDSALPPRHQFPIYDTTYWNSNANPNYPYLTNAIIDTHHDESSETFIEPALSTLQTSDALYPSSTGASLHLTNAVLTALGLNNDRIHKNAIINLGTTGPGAAAAEFRRKSFTADSWTPKSHSKPFYTAFITTGPNRSWEFNPSVNGVREFPPTSINPPTPLQADPFRPELRELLRVAPKGPLDSFVANPILGRKRPQRKLSINQILDRDLTDGRLRFRPLTPHPTNLPRQPVLLDHTNTNKYSISANMLTIFRNHTNDPFNNPAPNPLNIANVFDQEFMARYDRQRLCHDLFVMLYTFGGGPDVDYTTDNSGRTLYSDVQLREMAQFAANLVDYIDEDDIATVFEYDANLSNGWNLDDNAFSVTHAADGSLEIVSERAFVVGKEAQKLVLNEAIAILAKQVLVPVVSTPENHPATEYDDQKHRDFLGFEIQNVTSSAVSFANDAWQIRVTQLNNGVDPIVIEERRLVLRNAAGPVAAVGNAKSHLTIFTAGDNENRDAMGALRPSLFQVNPKYKDADDPSTFFQIMPRNVGVADLSFPNRTALDLMLDNNNTIGAPQTNLAYRVLRAEAPGSSGDGAEITHQPAATGNSGRELLGWINPAIIDTIGQGSVTLKFELRRRLNLGRQQPISFDLNATQHSDQSEDNPWIEVDEILVELGVFDLDDSTNTAANEVRQKLIDRTRSVQRKQPLYGDTIPKIDLPIVGVTNATALGDRFLVDEVLAPSDPLLNGFDPTVAPAQNAFNYRFNSLGSSNFHLAPIPPIPLFTIWEPHPDRPLASIAEMFDIPLYGPDETTHGNENLAALIPVITRTNQIGSRSTSGTLTYKINRQSTAGRKFVDPNITALGQVGNLGTSPASSLGNRWYRVLELLEFPDVDPHATVGPAAFPAIKSLMEKPWFVTDAGVEGMQGDGLGFYRTPGKLNINMLQHPAILAGLLDEPNALTYTPGANPTLIDTNGRNWWAQYLRTRDGVDPITSLVLPGVPGVSKPFRDFSHSRNGVGSLDHTLLRSMEAANGATTPPTPGRRLFELGTSAQNVNWSQNLNIDYTTRYRLLNKVMNNTTKRSNVFAVWITIGFFEVAEGPAGNSSLPGGELIPRIGGELGGEANGTRHRAFYIIDRSKAHTTILPSDLPTPNSQGPNSFIWSFNKDYDIDRSILHRQTIK